MRLWEEQLHKSGQNKKGTLFILLLLTLMLASCSPEAKKVVLATGTVSNSSLSTALTLQKLCAADSTYTLQIRDTYQTWEGKEIQLNSFTSCQMLADSAIDLSIAQSDVTLKEDSAVTELRNRQGLKTVTPLYPEFLFLLYRGEDSSTTFNEFISGKRILMGPRTGGTAQLCRRIFAHFQIAPNTYTALYKPGNKLSFTDSTDIICLVTHLDDPRISELLAQGASLYSFPQIKPAMETPLHGFSYRFPTTYPFVLPQNYYGITPPKPVHSLAVDALLLCKEEMPSHKVYDLVATLQKRAYLRERVGTPPLLFSHFSLKESSAYQFPLHEGAKAYLRGEEPTTVERKGHTLLVLLTLACSILGGLLALRRWKSHLMKERIDGLYFEALSIKKDVEREKSFTKMLNLKQQLVKLESSAYILLTKEKLKADESFSILTKMISDIETHLREKLD